MYVVVSGPVTDEKHRRRGVANENGPHRY